MDVETSTPGQRLLLPPPSRTGGEFSSRRWLTLLLAVLVLLLAVGLRLLNAPHRFESRDMDELTYSSGGLNAIEGVTPAAYASPMGPQTWLEMAYAGVIALRDTAHPAVGGARTPPPSWKVRPFIGLDQALFDIYSDMSRIRQFLLLTSLVIALAGTYCAFQLGRLRGGPVVGLMLGGLAASLPLFVEHAAMSKPHSDAWFLSFIAMYWAASRFGRSRFIGAGIFLGLALASRLDVMVIAPLVLWEFWGRPDPNGGFRSPLKCVGVAILTFLIAAPWVPAALVGVIRLLGTIGIGGGQTGIVRTVDRARELAWRQGLGPVIAAAAVGLAVSLRRQRLRDWVLIALVAAMALRVFTGPPLPTRYHAGAMIAMMYIAAALTGHVAERWPRWRWLIAAAVLVLPVAQSLRMGGENRRGYVQDGATAWIEENVPAGTRVYLQGPWEIRPPLPTPEAADAMWADVTDQHAWRRKFERGLQFYKTSASSIPRAMSEINLELDRGFMRRWFLLGSGNRVTTRPRYDVRVFAEGPVFEVQDPFAELSKTGGVIVWRFDEPPANAGEPVVKWLNSKGQGVRVYCSPDLRTRLSQAAGEHTK